MSELIRTFDTMLNRTSDQLLIGSQASMYEQDPEKYLIDHFRKPWSKQIDIINSVRDNKITAVRSCNDVGKTECLAGIFWWWLDVYRPYSKVVCTAKTFTAVRFILWARIRKLYKEVRPRFNNASINQTDFEPDPLNPDWLGVGYNPLIEGARNDPEAEATAFQGHHAKKLLIMIDEGMTTHPAIFKAAEGSLLDPGSRMIIVWNPTSSQGEVKRFESDLRAHLITISVYDLFKSPEYIADPEYYNELADPGEVKKMIATYGENSPIVMARIKGEYPKQDDKAIIKYGKVNECKDRYDDDDFEIGEIYRIIYSWDVAGDDGNDSNVLRIFYVGTKGTRTTQINKWQGKHSESMSQVFETITEEWNKWVDDVEESKKEDKEKAPLRFPEFILINDAVGEGSHVQSIMQEWFPDLVCIGFKAGYGSEGIIEREEIEFLNLNSESWFRAKLMIEGHIKHWKPFAADFSTTCIHELTSRHHEWKPKHKEPLVWQVEPKDDYKLRNHGNSPDEADAVIMGIYAITYYSSVLVFSPKQ